MQRLVGIIRTRAELTESLDEIEELKERAQHLSVEGHRQYNPGWHLALDLRNMLMVSECIAKAALERKESRGGHTRDDFPGPDPEWGALNLVLTLDESGESWTSSTSRCPRCPTSSKSLFEGGMTMGYDLKMRVWRGDQTGGELEDYAVGASRRARSSSTPSTGCRRPRPATWRCAGTARPASAARAAPRSTASRG